MASHMKTTIHIADPLLNAAKKSAESRGTTLRAVIESALRFFLEKEQVKSKPFKMKWQTFKGKGLQPDFQEGDWKAIREAAYEGRGAASPIHDRR